MSQSKKKLLTVYISLTIITLILTSYTIMKKEVTIKYDGKEKTIATFKKDVQDVLKLEDISVGPDDEVLPNLDSKLKDGMKIQVKRSKNINLTIDNEIKSIKTTAYNVEELLKDEKIKISNQDIVKPNLKHKIKSNDNIQIIRVNEKIITQTETIPYSLETIHDDNLELGKMEKVQDGEYGTKELTYKIVLNDGKESSRELVSEKVLANPRNEIVRKGTKNFVVTSRGDVKRYKKVLNVKATAYTAGYESTGKRPGDVSYGKTCTGTTVRPGVIAVDPNVIPFGSKVYIEELGMVGIAEDRGGAIKGNRIDIYMKDLKDARRFGVKNLTVYILE